MKPLNTNHTTLFSRTRSAQRRITNKKKTETNSQTNRIETDTVLLPQEEQTLFDDLLKLTNEITEKTLK